MNDRIHNNSKVPLKLLDNLNISVVNKENINKKNKSDDPNFFREINRIQICKRNVIIFNYIYNMLFFVKVKLY